MPGSNQSQVKQDNLSVRSSAFRPSRRDHCGESDPRRGGEMVQGDGGFWRAPSPPVRWRTSAEKMGVALSTIPPSRAAPRRAV